jgi:hypothetical protein
MFTFVRKGAEIIYMRNVSTDKLQQILEKIEDTT